MGISCLGEVSFSAEVSLLLLLGALLHNGQAAASTDSSSPLGGWPTFFLRWFFKEDTTSPTNSSIHSGPCGGGPGNPSELGHLVVQVPDLFPAHLGPHCLDGRDVPPVGPDGGDHVGRPQCRSCILPPSSPNGLLGGNIS